MINEMHFSGLEIALLVALLQNNAYARLNMNQVRELAVNQMSQGTIKVKKSKRGEEAL